MSATSTAIVLSPQTLPKPADVDPTAWSALRSNPVAMCCLAVVAFYLVLAMFSFLPFVQNAAAEQLSATEQYERPSLRTFPSRICGTDIQGRSVFYRTLAGCRVALIITVFASLLAISIGVVLGVVAGYFGGWVDEVVNWLVATLSSIPWILLILALGFVLQGVDLNFHGWLGREADGSPSEVPIPSVIIIVLALGLTDWVGICRLIRGEVLKQRALDYVSAARAMGLSQPRILFRHILPSTFHLVIITFTLGAVGYVQAEVYLTFLGIGISDKPSWGRMIDDAKVELLRGVWWQFTAATLAIGILCLALSLLGDTLRDILDPRTRLRR